MSTALLTAASLAAPAAIMGAVIAWDRLREPHRDPRRPFAVGGERDYRDACRRVDRLLAEDEHRHAWQGCVAISEWLKVRAALRQRPPPAPPVRGVRHLDRPQAGVLPVPRCDPDDFQRLMRSGQT